MSRVTQLSNLSEKSRVRRECAPVLDHVQFSSFVRHVLSRYTPPDSHFPCQACSGAPGVVAEFSFSVHPIRIISLTKNVVAGILLALLVSLGRCELLHVGLGTLTTAGYNLVLHNVLGWLKPKFNTTLAISRFTV